MSGCILDRHPSSQAFHDLLTVVGDTHDRKQKDYGTKRDPFFNVRATEHYDIPGWCGAVIRNNDKQARLMIAVGQTLTQGAPKMANESVRDSLIDQAVYDLIACVLYDEWEQR